MPAGVEFRNSDGEVGILLALSEPNVFYVGRKMTLLLSERLDIYCRYPDFGGLILFSVNPEGVEKDRVNVEALERLVEGRRRDPKFAGRTTLSGKPVRFEAVIGMDDPPPGEMVRFGLREEFLADGPKKKSVRVRRVRDDSSGLDVLVVSIVAKTVMVAINHVIAFFERGLAKHMRKPGLDGWVVLNLALPSADDIETLDSLVMAHNFQLITDGAATDSGRQIWISVLVEREPIEPKLALEKALAERAEGHAKLEQAQAKRKQLEAESAQRDAEQRKRAEREEAARIDVRARLAAEAEARAAESARLRERLLLPAAVSVTSFVALDFVLGLRSGAFGVASLPLLVVLGALVGFAATFRPAWSGAGRLALAAIAFGQAYGVASALSKAAEDEATALFAGAQLRALLLVLAGVLALIARDRSRTVLLARAAEMHALMGGLLGIALMLLVPRPAVAVCRDAELTLFRQSRFTCAAITDAAACARVPGCRTGAVCRAPKGYANDRDRCGPLSSADACRKQIFCEWVTCYGEPQQACRDFTPEACPAGMCQRVEY